MVTPTLRTHQNVCHHQYPHQPDAIKYKQVMCNTANDICFYIKFNSIENGIFTRLARLTSNTATNQNLEIDKLYPDHTDTLFTADLAPPTDFPIFKALWEEDEQQKNQPKNQKGENRINTQSIW
eukprot:6920323-Ditylum_brightwellii.AAC.1